MPIVNPSNPVAKIVIDHHAAARVLERFDLDYCCGGKRSLADMCDAEGLVLDDVVAAIDEAIVGGGNGKTDWASLPVDALAAAIDAAHHGYTRESLAHLGPLVEKVARVHGERHVELAGVRSLFATLSAELDSHLRKEEQELFPAVDALGKGDAGARGFAFAAGLAALRDEHEKVGALLRDLRTTTRAYAVPPGGCTSFRVLYAGLADLAADLHTHIHLENHLLFPKIEAALAAHARVD